MARVERQRQRQKKKRAEAIAPVQVKPLIVVVGLPPAVVGEIDPWIAAALQQPARVISISASPDDNNPYRTLQISTLLKSVADFAESKQRAEQQPAPSTIILLYVPGHAQEPMLASFDFFVFPIPLTSLASFEDGKQLRHRPTAIKAAIESALAPSSPSMLAFATVRARLTAVRDSEPLQMPPANFHYEKDRPIRDIFMEMRQGIRTWSDAVAELVEQEFDEKRIPHLRSGVRRRAFQDHRGLVFLRADLHALHGANREVTGGNADKEQDEDAPALHQLELLQGAFRFGCPLLAGFHHDVQLENDRSLKHISFDCARKGRASSAKAVYVNIYPNDVIRAKMLVPEQKSAAP